MEKPRKFYCSRHEMNGDRKNCRDCDVFYMSNLTVDAMSTWLEGEVPTEEDIRTLLGKNRLVDDNSDPEPRWPNHYQCFLDIDKLAQAIHALLTRKLTGKV